MKADEGLAKFLRSLGRIFGEFESLFWQPIKGERNETFSKTKMERIRAATRKDLVKLAAEYGISSKGKRLQELKNELLIAYFKRACKS